MRISCFVHDQPLLDRVRDREPTIDDYQIEGSREELEDLIDTIERAIAEGVGVGHLMTDEGLDPFTVRRVDGP